MHRPKRFVARLGLFCLLGLLPLLLSGCDRDLWRGLDRWWALEERLDQVERQSAEALRLAQEAKDLISGVQPAPTPVCTPAPAGLAPASEGGVALRVNSPISPTLQLYPILTQDELKVYRTFAEFSTDLTAITPTLPITATIVLAVEGTAATPERYTLYVEQARRFPLVAAPSWHSYSLNTSITITQPNSTFSLSSPQVMSTTRIFTTSAGSDLTTSLSDLQGADFIPDLARYLVLARSENGKTIYTLVVFSELFGAGSNPACNWCRQCGAPCRVFCRWCY